MEEALLHYQKAARLSPESAVKHYNLANTALLLDRFEEALDGFARAIEIEPDYLDAHCNLGVALQSLGRLDEAIVHLRRAVELAPAETESADLHWNLSLALLKNGDYLEGWREYEWRWQTPTFADFKREFSQPEWAGEPFQGKTILIHCEQGFGDAIQFARFVPLVAARGGRVVLECRPELKRLFATLDGVDAVIGLGDPLPPFDVQVAHMSLPRVLDIRLETIPADVPYLRVPDDAPADARITEAAGLKVGFAWAGSATRSDNIKRSCEPALFAPFVDVPGTVFFSLQVGPYADQLAEVGPAVVDVTDTLDDFADTAAVIGALDLVVSVDTAVLHLAAALGRPAWGLMSEPTGFLWMTERDDSPWYPTVRLFRQPAPGDWESVFQAAREELALLAGPKG